MITSEIVEQHGLSDAEYGRLLEILGRQPSLTELGIFSVMWSEHCSYKSSKRWLRTLPTDAPWVVFGPGENAGVIDIGDGQVAIFKMESHNHPSYIEPYQGAATGVGGILRDVFTMGARPVANLNSLRFGSPEHSKTRHLVSGVVGGIGGYGNCVGVPTVGGECTFDAAYNDNILVNAMTVGIAKRDRVFRSAASGVGSPLVYVGSKTGRDGIHGATMASAEFNEETEAKRPTVQIGDPFTEKLLIEACLELMATDAVIAIQDMGAAGLTSSSFEMASKGGVGIELDIDRVPKRETGMTAYEVLLSETQERMLMVLRPERTDAARRIFEKWELAFAVVGEITDTRRMVVRQQGEVVADVPIAPLVAAAPEYDRPRADIVPPTPLDLGDAAIDPDPMPALRALIGCPDLASKRWIWEQYDYMVMTNTIAGPGGDAAVVRVDGTTKALAITADCTPRYCLADPLEGGRQTVAEAWRNLCAVGARPLAITDCLNFGNPEKPPIMAQFIDCLRGMSEACSALEMPVVSGNVSFYNETDGRGIPPTPTVGGVGLLENVEKRVGIAVCDSEQVVFLLGEPSADGWLGQSLYGRVVLDRQAGAPPPVDLLAERRNGEFVRGLIDEGRITACHDVSDGGLLVALAEMALAGGVGIQVEMPPFDAVTQQVGWLFGEDQARYIVVASASQAEGIGVAAAERGVALQRIGVTGGSALTVGDRYAISIAELSKIHEAWLPSLMGPR